MAAKRKEKTNAIRRFDSLKIPYTEHTYGGTGAISGVEVASVLGQDPEDVFKTLVTEGKSHEHYVFMVPVAEELDLKKAAAAAGEKSLAMLHVRDLEPTTGYVRGGCSPVGMKRVFPTLIDETVQLFDEVGISGGRRGLSLTLSPDDLVAFTGATLADLCRDGR